VNTLIIDFADMGSISEIGKYVYCRTLDFLYERIPNSVRRSFTQNDELIHYIIANSIEVVICTRKLPLTTSLMLKGLGLVQIILGSSDELKDVVDIVIDPLILNSEDRNRAFLGPAYLLPHIAEQLQTDEIIHHLQIDNSTLEETMRRGEADVELLEICTLFSILKWDSAFFGYNIAYLKCLRLTPNIEGLVRRFAIENMVTLIEYLCDCHDRVSVTTAERAGFSFVDIRLTFMCHIKSLNIFEERDDFSVGKGNPGDINALKTIAASAYADSRYYFDGNFRKEKIVEFYTGWLEKAILGTFDDYALVLYSKLKVPIGFCTIRNVTSHMVQIGLFGIDRSNRGKGLGLYLLNQTLKHVQLDGKEYVEVVTQGRNYEAQRLYQRTGFVTKKTELWYHKWIH
jgi:dTDP-4-amino-4,6-dideoxy-D-galactose acyltransferase